MLLDDKGFVPGHTTKRTYRVAFDSSDLGKCYHKSTGCPIYSALERAGVPVESVGRDSFLVYESVGDRKITISSVKFTADLQKISNFLLATDLLFPLRRYARWFLRGREFEVTV